MLFDPSRHEPLQERAWDEAAARAAIERIVRDAEARFSPQAYWPLRPGTPTATTPRRCTPLLRRLRGDLGARLPARGGRGDARTRLREWRRTPARSQPGVAGEGHVWPKAPSAFVPLRRHRRPDAGPGAAPGRDDDGPPSRADRRQPRPPGARADVGLAWHHCWRRSSCTGAPARHAGPTCSAARRAALWSQLLWSDEYGCHYWMQDLYGHQSSYLDAVHGFVGHDAV